MQIKTDRAEQSGLTHWWIEDESGGLVIQSSGYVDPQECQKNLDRVRAAFKEEFEKEQS